MVQNPHIPYSHKIKQITYSYIFLFFGPNMTPISLIRMKIQKINNPQSKIAYLVKKNNIIFFLQPKIG